MNIATDINDKELLATLENSINAADSYAESEIGEQRNKGHRYYYGKPLGNERAGRSQHVSMDVFDATESVKAMMMETFTADRNVRSEEHTSELQSPVPISYDVFCLKKKKIIKKINI